MWWYVRCYVMLSWLRDNMGQDMLLYIDYICDYMWLYVCYVRWWYNMVYKVSFLSIWSLLMNFALYLDYEFAQPLY